MEYAPFSYSQKFIFYALCNSCLVINEYMPICIGCNTNVTMSELGRHRLNISTAVNHKAGAAMAKCVYRKNSQTVFFQ